MTSNFSHKPYTVHDYNRTWAVANLGQLQERKGVWRSNRMAVHVAFR
jgi:hypothetical protein